MPRNLYERVEVMFPVKDPVLRESVFGGILQTYLKDTRKARILRQDGTYTRTCQESATKPDNGNRFSAQEFFIERAEGRSTKDPASTKYVPLELASRDLGLAVVA
jgi:polyphosphate kinase